MINWQKPFDTAPKDGTFILAWYEEDREAHSIYFSRRNARDGDWIHVGTGRVVEDPEYSAWAEINPPERGGWDHMVARQNEYVIDNPTEGWKQ